VRHVYILPLSTNELLIQVQFLRLAQPSHLEKMRVGVPINIVTPCQGNITIGDCNKNFNYVIVTVRSSDI
jgi:hypothetical protein